MIPINQPWFKRNAKRVLLPLLKWPCGQQLVTTLPEATMDPLCNTIADDLTRAVRASRVGDGTGSHS